MVGLPKIRHQSAYLKANQNPADNISNPNIAAKDCTIGPSITFLPPLPLVVVDIWIYHPLIVVLL